MTNNEYINKINRADKLHEAIKKCDTDISNTNDIEELKELKEIRKILVKAFGDIYEN